MTTASEDLLKRITARPDVFNGKPIIRDMRISVELVRILITMDKDFGELIHLHRRPHTGLIRLPEVRMAQRITLVEDLILNHRQALDERAIITVTNSRIRISRQQLR